MMMPVYGITLRAVQYNSNTRVKAYTDCAGEYLHRVCGIILVPCPTTAHYDK